MNQGVEYNLCQCYFRYFKFAYRIESLSVLVTEQVRLDPRETLFQQHWHCSLQIFRFAHILVGRYFCAVKINEFHSESRFEVLRISSKKQQPRQSDFAVAEYAFCF